MGLCPLFFFGRYHEISLFRSLVSVEELELLGIIA